VETEGSGSIFNESLKESKIVIQNHPCVISIHFITVWFT